MKNVVMYILIALVIGLVMECGYLHYQYSRVDNIVQKLAEYSIAKESDITIITIPNFIQGGSEEYAIVGLLTTESGSIVPHMIPKLEYDTFYDSLRSKIVMFQEMMKEANES